MRPVTEGVTKTVPVMGTVGQLPNKVGVAVGSRVGMGACVGVAGGLPVGKIKKVGGGKVAVGARVDVGIKVAVGERCSNMGRTSKLAVPPQYIIIALMMTMNRQP